MTQQVRINFLNWQPDMEDFGNEGLVNAQNVVHEPEGYKPVYLASAGVFSTTGGLASVSSIVTKPVGSAGDTFSAWLSANTLHVGINGATATNATGSVISFATTGSSQGISFFDVTEFGDYLVFTVEAQQTQASPATTATLRVMGYLTVA
jgi:hypothetical protein